LENLHAAGVRCSAWFGDLLSGSVTPVVFESLIDSGPLEFIGFALELQVRHDGRRLRPVEYGKPVPH